MIASISWEKITVNKILGLLGGKKKNSFQEWSFSDNEKLRTFTTNKTSPEESVMNVL